MTHLNILIYYNEAVTLIFMSTSLLGGTMVLDCTWFHLVVQVSSPPTHGDTALGSSHHDSLRENRPM